MFKTILGMIFSLAMAMPALAWDTPARGTADRAGLMDAIRPHAEWALGAPVQFVVYDLRRWGNLAFASVYPQRPGGQEINMYQTPIYRRGHFSPDVSDGPGLQALFVKSGQTWVAVHWVIGATDVWYAYGELCAVWRPVIPEVCQGL